MLTLSHCYAPERQYLPEGSVYTWQVPRYFSPPHKVTPWLVGSGGQGACHPGSKGTVAIEEAVFDRLPLPGHWRDSILKHTQILPVKEDHWHFVLRGQLQVWHTLEANEGILGKRKPTDTIFVFYLWLVPVCRILQKEAFISFWCSNFCDCHAGDAPW